MYAEVWGGSINISMSATYIEIHTKGSVDEQRDK